MTGDGGGQVDVADGTEATSRRRDAMARVATGIHELDVIAHGGLPRGRATLVAGSAGAAKTILGAQFLVAGVREADEHGVFVTFEEDVGDICRNTEGLGWDLGAMRDAGEIAFVDASPTVEGDGEVVGRFDVAGLVARITAAIEAVGAQRVVIDSIGALFSRFPDPGGVRTLLRDLLHHLRAADVTVLVTAERTQEFGPIARHGVEEFIADNVIILRNVLEDEKRRRTMEILKMRGASHQRGEFPFTIVSGDGRRGGIVLLPLSARDLTQPSSGTRVSIGIPALDEMCGGGILRDSIILVSGATGTGKTLTSTHFTRGGVRDGERCMIFAFEESRDQLIRNATGWGMDYEAMEAEGRLRIISDYPETENLEDRLVTMTTAVQDFAPTRVAVDSLSALERTATDKSFREFVLGLTSMLKERSIAGLFTSTTPTLMGGTSITEAHISTLTDSIILLRYVETYGEMRRGLTVLKMRGSWHDTQVRQFSIGSDGMEIGAAFRNITGIVSGRPHYAPADELGRLSRIAGVDDEVGGAADGVPVGG